MSTTKFPVQNLGTLRTRRRFLDSNALWAARRFGGRNRCVAISFRIGGTHPCTVERFPDAAAEYARAVRFLQDSDAAFHHLGQYSRFIAITGGKDHGNTR